MLNLVICDDSEKMLNRLETLLDKAFLRGEFDIKIVLKTTSYENLLDFVKSKRVDIVFLDIQFNNSSMSGLDIARQIREINKDCYIIFTTSHMEYVMQAYEFKTFAYLIKNTITVDLLVDTLSRLLDDISGISNKYIKIDNKGTFLYVNSIQFIEKRNVKLIFHTYNEDYYAYGSFSKIESLLDKSFVRCHKSYIANINNILTVKSSSNEIIFKNNSVCFIGPKYKNKFMEVFNNDVIF